MTPNASTHGQGVTTLRVTGMTCAACERRVIHALAALPDVASASASAARGSATLETRSGTAPDEEAVRAALAAVGYQLGAPAWLTRDGRAWATAIGTTAVLVVIGWLATRTGLSAPNVGFRPDGPAGSLLLALFVGLAAGVSTCMALVGGLVLGVSAAGGPGARRLHLAFTVGRLAGFSGGGALLGVAGSAARLPDSVVAGTTVVAAAVMALLGLRLTGLSPRLSGWTLSLPARWSLGAHRGHGATLAGAATFLLPCGFTQAMQIYAVSLGSPALSGGVMAAFAVGTTPGLLGLATLGNLSRRRLRGRAAVRGIGVVVLAFAMITGAGGLRGLGVSTPELPGSAASVVAAGQVSDNVRLVGDVQIVSMTQHADGYSPAHSTVWAGLPIRWTVDVTSGFACSAFLRVPSLGVSADLPHKGRHVVEVPPLAEGTTRFTCTMGMHSGSFRAIARPS